MEGKISKASDALFALWSKKLEPTLCKLKKEYIDTRCSDDEMFKWWDILGKHQKKSKHGEIIEALNFISCTRLRDLMKHLSSSIDANCKELHSKNAEIQKSEAMIQNLQSQLDKLLAEQLALSEKCKNHKGTIADLKAKLNEQEFMSPKTLNSDGAKKHVHFLEEVTSCDDSRTFSSEEACATAQKSVPISVLKVMQHRNSAESWTRTHGVKKALESHENPQTSGEHSKQPCGKDSRFCNSCHKIGHTEEKCWSLGRGRPPPYFQKDRKPLSKGRNQCSFAGKTLSELTALFMQGLQLLTSLASGLAA